MITIESTIHFKRRGKTKRIQAGEKPKVPARVPRVARLMGLAIRFEDLLREGEVTDYAELARLAHVSRARITQIMNLLLLAPDIQEALLFLEPVERGRDRVKLRQLQKVALEVDWERQKLAMKHVLPLTTDEFPKKPLLSGLPVPRVAQ